MFLKIPFLSFVFSFRLSFLVFLPLSTFSPPFLPVFFPSTLCFVCLLFSFLTCLFLSIILLFFPIFPNNFLSFFPFFLQHLLTFIFLSHLYISFHYFLFSHFFLSFHLPITFLLLPKFPPFCSLLPYFLHPTFPNSLSLPSFFYFSIFLLFSFLFFLFFLLSFHTSFLPLLVFSFSFHTVFLVMSPPPHVSDFFLPFLLPFLPCSSRPDPHLYSWVQWMMKSSNPLLTNQYQCESEGSETPEPREELPAARVSFYRPANSNSEETYNSTLLSCAPIPYAASSLKTFTYNTKKLAV